MPAPAPVPVPALGLVLVLLVACTGDRDDGTAAAAVPVRVLAAAADVVDLADGFDFPVGAPDGEGYYDAQAFGGPSRHLGEDWNGVLGGDSDLGDPVHAVARGRVTFAGDLGGGWGNVVRVAHSYTDGDGRREVESLYAHLDAIHVEAGATVARGQVLGTIGTAGGTYVAHLHLELRATVGLPIGGGYGEPLGQIAPTPFITAHRSGARTPPAGAAARW